MESILEQLCNAYQTSFKENGAHAPLTTQIRQLIVRFWQGTGQQRVIEMNREFSQGAIKRADVETGVITDGAGLKTFVHPKARAASESAKKQPAGQPTIQPEKLGRMTRHLKASLTGEPPHPLTQPESLEQIPSPQSGKKVVAGDDVTVDPGAETTATMVAPMTDAEIVRIAEMSPAEIVSQFGETWVLEKLLAHNIEHQESAKPAKLAAILKSKVKA